MHTQPEKQVWQGIIRWRPHQPIFGRLSLRVFVLAGAVCLVFMLILFFGFFGVRSLGYFVLGL